MILAMKKYLVLIFTVILLPMSLFAQTDWAKTVRYSEDNANVALRPKAVFMGDSITDNWPKFDADFFSDNNFLGRGISGQTTSHMLSRFRYDVVNLHPKYVVILAGTNDIALNNGPVTLDNILCNIISMCDIAKANRIKPILCSILPCKRYGWRPEVTDAADQILKLNDMIKAYALDNSIPFVDYHSSMKDDENALLANLSNDGCHPNAEGYEIMKSIVLDYIK